MKFKDLEVDQVFQFSSDAELDIGRAMFQKQNDTTAFLVDDLVIDPETEVALADFSGESDANGD